MSESVDKLPDSILALLDFAEQYQASDIFLQEDQIPKAKIHKVLQTIDAPSVTHAEMQQLWHFCGANPHTDQDVDSSLSHRQLQRFRVNLHQTLDKLGAVLRRIKTSIPSLDSLGLPHELLQQWVKRKNGLILITGPTGSGKSTTLAALLQWMNQHEAKHVVTIEDPIEYLFHAELCHFTQRQVGKDTASFANGLRSALRQAPDIILLGEIRDFDSALIALQAAETGHLVLATMHAESNIDTLDRYHHLFTQDQIGYGRHLLAEQLIGIVSQKLVPHQHTELHLLTEFFENAGGIKEWIRRRETQSLQAHLQRQHTAQSQSFLQSALQAWQQGHICTETALESVSNENEMRRAMRGIF